MRGVYRAPDQHAVTPQHRGRFPGFDVLDEVHRWDEVTAGVVLGRLRPYIESRDTSSFRFSIANANKDMGYYAAMAEETGAARETALGVLHTYQQACKAGLEQATVPEIIDLMVKQP